MDGNEQLNPADAPPAAAPATKGRVTVGQVMNVVVTGLAAVAVSAVVWLSRPPSYLYERPLGFAPEDWAPPPPVWARPAYVVPFLVSWGFFAIAMTALVRARRAAARGEAPDAATQAVSSAATLASALTGCTLLALLAGAVAFVVWIVQSGGLGIR